METTSDVEEKKYLRDEKKQLREKERQLRDEKGLYFWKGLYFQIRPFSSNASHVGIPHLPAVLLFATCIPSLQFPRKFKVYRKFTGVGG